MPRTLGGSAWRGPGEIQAGTGLRQHLEDEQGDENLEIERKRQPPAVDNAWKEGQWPVENNSETSCLQSQGYVIAHSSCQVSLFSWVGTALQSEMSNSSNTHHY